MPRFIPILVAAGLTWAASGDDPFSRVLVDRELRRQTVSLMSIGPNGVSFSTADGRVLTRPASEVLAILPTGESAFFAQPPAAAGGSWISARLVDGQVFVGRVRMSGDGEGERLPINSPLFGDLSLPLERLSTIELLPRTPGTPFSERIVDDEVILSNGDTLRGFVEQLGPDIVVDENGTRITLPIDRVRAVRLGNPAEVPAGAMLWLDSGDVVRVGSLKTDAGELVLTIDGTLREDAGASISLADVVGASFDASRVVPLASLEMVSAEPSGDRRWTEPPVVGDRDAFVLGAAPIALPGPVRTAWRLPAGAARVSGIIDIADDAGAWTDCEIRVYAVTRAGDERTIASIPSISRQTPSVAFQGSIPPGSAELVVEVLPGRFGPIQDRVVLRRALVRIDPTGEVR